MKQKPCKECGKEFPVEELSRKGLCRKCGVKRQLEWQDTMRGIRHKIAKEVNNETT